jgi:hypothetical protein
MMTDHRPNGATSPSHTVPIGHEKNEAQDPELNSSPSGKPEEATSLSGTEASGGKKLGAMRYVLSISLMAVVVILAGLLLIYR